MATFTPEDKEAMSALVEYIVSKAAIGAENIESGLLTGEVNNNVSKDELMPYLLESQNIMVKVAELIDNSFQGQDIAIDTLSHIWQYMFDRSVEATYKLITNPEGDIDTMYRIQEAFDFYEIDLPEYIQLKLTNVVGNVAILFRVTMEHVDEEYKNSYPRTVWLSAMFIALHQIAVAFALQLDLNDTSEMDRFLYGD